MRQRISERVQAGDVDTALELTRQLAPGLLEADRHIHFRLQCQKFAEMVGAPGRLLDAFAAAGALCMCMLRLLALYPRPPVPLPTAPPTAPSKPQIKAGQVAEAIEYGRTHVVPLTAGGAGGAAGAASAAAAERELLEDATALLAYDDPSTAPTGACVMHGRRVLASGMRAASGHPGTFVIVAVFCRMLNLPSSSPDPATPPPGYLLLPGHRGELAAALNRAILAHSGRSADSALEALARQAGAVLQVGGGKEGWGGRARASFLAGAALSCLHCKAALYLQSSPTCPPLQELKRSGHPAAQLLDLQALLELNREEPAAGGAG